MVLSEVNIEYGENEACAGSLDSDVLFLLSEGDWQLGLTPCPDPDA